jgi:cell wall-associated NlpC family hydrolase
MSRKKSASHEKPRRKPGLSWFLRVNDPGRLRLGQALVWFCCAASLVAGCAPTAPRFRSGESRPAASSVRTERAGPKKDTLQSKDEDVEKSVEGAKEIASETRSFRSEKNAAISGLDQAKMMREISKFMGVSYKLGGEDENGIDCSAYTMTVYKKSLGKLLPRSSAEQYKIGIPVASDDLKFGDLVFFNTTGEPASHVGIYLGDDLFAHASVSLGVTISSLESTYFKRRYNGARRIIQ